MKYIIDKSADKSAYLQLYIQLRDDIVNGTLAPGTKLPSKRLLSEETGVSLITVQHSYAMLCDEGYVTARERSGYYVAKKSSAIIPTHRKKTQNIKSFGAGKTDTADTAAKTADFPFTAYAKTIRKVLSDHGEKILIKSPGKGCYELRAAISEYLLRFRGMETDPEQIIIGAGAEYLYSLLIQLFGRDNIYGIENPSYEKIQKVYTANNVRYELLPLCGDGIASEALESSAANILHITPYHSFPSGISASASKRVEYISYAKKCGGYIIEDDYDSEFSVFAKPVDTIFSIAPNGMVVYVNTFSQSLSSAMRIGYMVLPNNLLSVYNQKLDFYSCTVPVFDQYILAEFINSGELERHINRIRRKKRRGEMI